MATQVKTAGHETRARAAFTDALLIAKAGALDGLAVDAIHMFAFIDTAPADQLNWAQEALAQFKLALTLREQGSNPGAVRVANWMVV
jgi:hypothetical protein